MSITSAFHHYETDKPSFAQFDADGFLISRAEWNRELATIIAEEEGIEHLTMNHWRVINYIRKRYAEFLHPPLMRRMCRATGLDKTEVKSLFGDCRAMWRIAGMPNPGEEAKSYMF